MSLMDKSLLILGANPETVPLIETAKTLGVRTLVTDNNPNAFAKAFAHVPCNIDGKDIDGLVELVRREGIDGVLVGVADRLIIPYQQVCERLGLPCYASREQSEVLTDKLRFNERCKQYGILSIPSFELPSSPELAELNDLPYPILIKPVDSNSGKGLSICNHPGDVWPAIQKALLHSSSGRYLAEEYMVCDDIFINFTRRQDLALGDC